MNFVEVKKCVHEVLDVATYSGMASYFLRTRITFGAMSTAMLLNLIFKVIFKAKFKINGLGAG